jgi:hypothetical protein
MSGLNKAGRLWFDAGMMAMSPARLFQFVDAELNVRRLLTGTFGAGNGSKLGGSCRPLPTFEVAALDPEAVVQISPRERLLLPEAADGTLRRGPSGWLTLPKQVLEILPDRFNHRRRRISMADDVKMDR